MAGPLVPDPPGVSGRRVGLLAFPAAVFLGAFLLFLVQPLIAKQILPWFGGASAVWTTCLLFFQVALVAGYGYAHLTRRLGPRWQVRLHLLFLAVAMLMLPIGASAAWKPLNGSAPVWHVLGLLTAAVGVPFVMLATTAPIVQDWYARVVPAEEPYRLYALSNTGSLLALLSYPFVVERYLSVSVQAVGWSAAFVVFAGLSAACAWQARHGRSEGSLAAPATNGRPSPSAPDRALWVLLPACGSGLLLAVTNQLTLDVAVVPLLWVLPLALYLLTYVAAFAGWYARVVWGVLFAAGFIGTVYVIANPDVLPVTVHVGLLLLGLVAGCMICHGELAGLRPPVTHLTGYYLALAAGGSVGGLFVAIVAPLVFDHYLELPVLLTLVPGLLVVVTFRPWVRQFSGWRAGLLTLGPVTVQTAVVIVVLLGTMRPQSTIALTRDFFGVLRVADVEHASGPLRGLFHGRVLHGAQFREDPLRGQATTYYGEGSGAEVAMRLHARRLVGEPLEVGIVGLGAGTLAVWGLPGDRLRFFELDPSVVRFAHDHFTFLADTRARVDVVAGDARLALERELDGPGEFDGYDVLVVDAFAGGSIPVHLLTREAFDLYWRALRVDGILALHVSNRFLDLESIVRSTAAERHREALRVTTRADPARAVQESVWMVVSADEGFLARTRSLETPAAGPSRDVIWTDAFSSLLSVLR